MYCSSTDVVQNGKFHYMRIPTSKYFENYVCLINAQHLAV